MRRPASGVSSDDLNTTVSPASSAGTMWPFGRWPGKLNGPSTAITPCGRWRSTARPKPVAASRDPARSAWAAMETSTLAIMEPSSALVSHSGLPVSRDRSAANSAVRASSTAL